MSLIIDAIRARNADTLRSAPPDQVRTELVAFWDREEAAKVPDLDYLMQAGMLIATAAIPDIEHSLSFWLDQNTTPNAWDTAGAFLMGYWQDCGTVDTGLVDRLTTILTDATPPAASRDTIVCALGHAFRKMSDPKRQDRIRDMFKPIWDREHKQNMQPLVRNVLKKVLDIEE